jgi:hypothetical protein
MVSLSLFIVLCSEGRHHGGSRFLKVQAMRSDAFGAPGFDLGKLFAFGCFLLGKTTLFACCRCRKGHGSLRPGFGHRGQP